MYNNIKKFVNPKYATLFLFCVTILLVIVFMKSRKEPFSRSEQREIDRKLDNNTTAVNKAIQDTNVIQNLRDNKADKTELSSYAKTTDLTKGLGSKLSTSDFGTTLAKDPTITGLQNNKLDKSVYNEDLKSYAKTTDLAKKLNTSDFGTTLANNTTIQNLQNNKLDKSVYENDMKTVPTMNSLDTTIGGVVDSKVSEKVGIIQDAKTAYDTAYGLFNENASGKTIAFNNNASGKTTAFNENASGKTTDFNLNADSKTASFNVNYNNKYGSINALKTAAETANTDAQAARDAAVDAQFESKKIYDDVFGEQTGKVITQSNVYRSGFKFNERTGYYESGSESFTTIEGLVSDDIFTKEKTVIEDINNFNTKYYEYLRCKAESSKCPQGKTAAALKEKLLELSATLQGSVADLKTAYSNLGQDTDNTQSLLDKAAQIDDLRQDLDAKMARILESKNPPNEMTQQLDSTVYAGILWSVLGTSLLYYIFTE
jgi:hypothetical protein